MSIVHIPKSSADIIGEFTQVDYMTKRLIDEFDKPLFDNAIYKNMDFLTREVNHESVLFNKGKWTSNPKQFCVDHYDNHYLDQLILLVNNIPNFFEFTNDRIQHIKAPKLGIILHILKELK
jgi:hypothetical protein